jgi:hypothetical protein
MAAGFPFAQVTSGPTLELLTWLGVVVLAAMLMGGVLMWAKKYAQRALKGGIEPPGQLTIEKLEEMRRSGLISQEEFSSLRRAALGLGRAADKGHSGLTPKLPEADDNRNDEAAGSPPTPS